MIFFQRRFFQPYSILLGLMCWLSLVLLYTPLVFLIACSFISDIHSYSTKTFTFQWYIELFRQKDLIYNLKTSFFIALGSSLGSTLLGTLTAIGMQKTPRSLRWFLQTLSLLPMMMPEIVLGLALLLCFAFCRIMLGPFSLIAAHITFSISYVILSVRQGLDDLRVDIQEAAHDLGAVSWKTFWHVTLPLIFPNILTGAIIAFTLSFDDFLITFFTSGAGLQTLPLKIYSLIKIGSMHQIHALSSIMIFCTLILAIAAAKLQRKPL